MRKIHWLAPFSKVPEIPSEKQPSAEHRANWFSRATWTWLSPLLRTGYLRNIEKNDLWSVADNQQAARLQAKLEERLEMRYNQLLERRVAKLKKAKKPATTKTSIYPGIHYENDEADPDHHDDHLRQQAVSALNKSSLPLAMALNDTFFWQFWFSALMTILRELCAVASALVSKELINYIERRFYDRNFPMGTGIGSSIGMFLLAVGVTFFFNHSFYAAQMVGAKSRAALIGTIFKKSTKLSISARKTHPPGKITNLAALDAHRVDFACQFVHQITAFPITTACSIAVLCVNLHESALVGVGTMLLFIVSVAYITKYTMNMRKRIMKWTDKRVTLIRDALQNIRIIKYYGWEVPTLEKIQVARREEANGYIRMGSIRGITFGMFESLPTIAGALSFITYSSIGNETDPAKIFSSLTLFNLLLPALIQLPMAMQYCGDARMSLRRIHEFLHAEEGSSNIVIDAEQSEGILVQDGCFEWPMDEPLEFFSEKQGPSEKAETRSIKSLKTLRSGKSVLSGKSSAKSSRKSSISSKFSFFESNDALSSDDEPEIDASLTLNNVNLSLKPGSLTVVVGAIGSGKTSLLSALSNLMLMTDGCLSFSSENWIGCLEPWIQNSSIRDNIVFGREFDADKYRKVLQVCQLASDLDNMEYGDKTMIGERGITVSGGQKARINLARAVYGKPDILIMDDVLSAVDARVGQAMIEQCIDGYLKDSTRVLATHQVGIVERADHVIFMEKPDAQSYDNHARIHQGTVAELSDCLPQFRALIEAGVVRAEIEMEEQEPEKEETEVPGKIEFSPAAKRASRVSMESSIAANMMAEEERVRDSVGFGVYKRYFLFSNRNKALSVALIVLCAFLMLLVAFLTIFASVWLSFWTADKFLRSKGFYMGIYIMLGMVLLLLITCFIMASQVQGTRSIENMHNLAIETIIRAPVAFFDTTPMGRILNRFTRDTDSLDNEVSMRYRMLFFSLTEFVGSFAMTIVFVPYTALVLAPIIIVFVVCLSYYRQTAREVKRIDSIERSAMLSVFSESITGMPVIVMYGAQSNIVSRLHGTLDIMNSAYFIVAANQRWLSLRLDAMGSLVVLICTILCAAGVFHLTPSNMGLIVSQAASIPENLSMMAQGFSELENCMNAAERILHYHTIDAEGSSKTVSTTPSAPPVGKIEFDNVSLKYRPELSLVLKNLTVTFEPGHKIGICGRTGAGKSTILQSLFRIVELETGKISIDGVDIASMSLEQLRKGLSNIPQESVLFAGTVRSNLDPLGEHTDAEMWSCLQRSGLTVALDTKVDSDGSNFSLGERQLLTLARALLRNSQILVLDEATSNVDYQTDALVQQTIAQEFSHCTILCIAHRLRTIVNYDRILVLEDGEMLQYGSPQELYRDDDGMFRRLCEASGIKM
ncbi:Oligomycin resistance ATP-dependent permease YOR1 [Yarrowia sp. B02]|nr:Oligomycin resistance ATP-dependent permease YOR1 [Yarrowia sp. B02]